GKYVGSKNLPDTVLRTNLEAAAEIAHQLRLRNTGGIVIIDFIDMSAPTHQEAVLEQFATSLKADKTRTNLLGFTRLGLVELTRKKTERLLSHVLEVDCPHCKGRGRVISDETLAYQIAREVRSLALENVDAIGVYCHPAVAGFLIGPGGSNLRVLEKHTGKTISVQGDDSFVRQDYRVQSCSSD
ncbi:MAG TPA: ribonuclease E/G, partial [Limnochordia bacterium]|nr:ribonuclease E/G [Limnochordia bacterium]